MAFAEFQSTLTAVKEGQYTLNTTHRLPSHNPLPLSYILIQVSFVALNPCNWKMIDFPPAIGTVGGNHFSGRVVAIGAAVSKWRIGDSVCGFLYGLDPHVGEGEWAGAFAEYVSVPGDLVMRVVEHRVSMAEATSGSTGGRKASTHPYILVYGGMGYYPITTCSPAHDALVQSYGAVRTFDYHSASCGVAIRAFTEGQLSLIVDCITSTDRMKICYAAMGAHGGRYVGLEPPATRIQTAPQHVQTDWIMALTIFGKPVDMKGPFGQDAVPGDYNWAAQWYALAEKLLEEDRLRPHPALVQAGGWEGILKGIEELRCGRVRGKKLVYAVGE
ncbi:hypothetical protein BDV26DRAFT_300766 [Aspergillus bertholletiae]|uniref:Alcohol dehydrogenase-like N-terminal domain-containing protein n=1 Tax=Aspergillus bertholletiae TaxID=1226010 RepID=A0A5N7BJ84_9EURO|nr:hypothetical protein BDV26DRAFT_300766 [Aspergillus bertholletiae]